MPGRGGGGGGYPRAKVTEKVVREFFFVLIQPHGHLDFFFWRIETGHEVLDELIGRCCGELSIVICGNALHGLSRIKRQ